MENKNIVLIGCGDNSAMEAALKLVQEHREGAPAVFHAIPSDIDKDELKMLALEFQQKDMEVLICSDGLDIAKELRPEPIRPEFNMEPLKLTMPKVNYEPYIKEDNKPPVYPKRNYKSRLKKNRKRK